MGRRKRKESTVTHSKITKHYFNSVSVAACQSPDCHALCSFIISTSIQHFKNRHISSRKAHHCKEQLWVDWDLQPNTFVDTPRTCSRLYNIMD